MTLTRYCEPIRALPVDAMDTEAVLSVLKPLWTRAPETASRLRGRIEAVLDAAKARGFIERHEANPAHWKGHLDKLLPKRAKLARGHHAAMPYADVPAFIAELRQRPATAARALEFAILTAARSGEVLAARWDEIDFDGEGLDGSGRADEGGARASRSVVGSRARDPQGNGERAGRANTCSPAYGPDGRFPAWRSKCCCGASSRHTAHGFRSHSATGRATKRISRANSPNTRWRTSSATRPSKPIGDRDALARRRELMDAWARHCEGAGGKVLEFKRPA